MDEQSSKPKRRPRFQRAKQVPSFRLTEDDITIVRMLAQYRFLRSTHIATLLGRSLDRINDRLLRLFHAGYVDRPRAQLDYYPTSGSAPMVYALADRGARLLIERNEVAFANAEWSRKNREVGRPFIEHQLEIVDFSVAVQVATFGRTDIEMIHPEQLIKEFPDQSPRREPFKLTANITQKGVMREVGVIPDYAFGLRFSDGSRRCFLVEIDRGTMPVSRSDISQTSFERKMRAYLSAQAAKQHEKQFGWRAFRVLTVTTDATRLNSMCDALAKIRVPSSLGGPLFFFATRDELSSSEPLSASWVEGSGKSVRLT